MILVAQKAAQAAEKEEARAHSSACSGKICINAIGEFLHEEKIWYIKEKIRYLQEKIWYLQEKILP